MHYLLPEAKPHIKLIGSNKKEKLVAYSVGPQSSNCVQYKSVITAYMVEHST